MKKKLIFLCLLLFIAYILTAPKDAVNAASVGLVLWYTRVLPTLLPFVILSNILMDSNYLQYLNKITAPLVSRLIPVSDNGAFVPVSYTHLDVYKRQQNTGSIPVQAVAD